MSLEQARIDHSPITYTPTKGGKSGLSPSLRPLYRSWHLSEKNTASLYASEQTDCGSFLT
jgi:hypothetical protein